MYIFNRGSLLGSLYTPSLVVRSNGQRAARTDQMSACADLRAAVQGLLERLAVDPSGANWLMTGSSRGHLTLWDMRFQLAVNSTQMAQVSSRTSTVPYGTCANVT